MATFTATPSNWTNATSDANFRAWGEYISDQMTAVGLLKTADTGQIDWATVTNPGAINTYAGYEIRAFADTLQSTAPVYFKIEYGEGSGTDQPSIRLSMGAGSDGSGTLTGNPSATMVVTSVASASGITVYGSGSTNRFSFITDLASGMIFSIERTKDALGNDTSEGVMFFGKVAGTASTLRSSLWLRGIGSAPNNPTTTSVACMTGNQASFASGSQVGICPIFCEKPIFTNPALGIIGFHDADIAAGGFAVYMYGTSHTYIKVDNAPVNYQSFRGGVSTSAAEAAVLYE